MKTLYIAILIIILTIPASINTNKEYVYICTGYYSKCYHKTDTCEGLKNCSRDIIKVTKEDAIDKYHRKPCRYCYQQNATDNNN